MKEALEIAGDIWHAPAVIHRAIGQRLEEQGWRVTKIYDNNVPFERLNQYDLIILSRYALDDTKDNRIQKHLWITPEQEELIEQYVLHGGRILFHHDGISHYPRGGGVSRTAKAFRIDHPPMGRISVYPSASDEKELVKEIEPFEVEDEEFNLEINEQEVTVFLTSVSKKHGRHLQGWCHVYGKGKAAVFIPGHDNTVLNHPMVAKLVKNVLKWLTD